MSTDNATRKFLGGEAQWANTRAGLDDIQGLWGGRRIAVDGSGEATVQIVERGLVGRRYAFELAQAEWQALLDVFVQNDFVSIQPQDRPGLPDEAHPTITLTNTARETYSVAKWAGVEDERFDAIYVALVQLETYTLGLEPVETGPVTL